MSTDNREDYLISILRLSEGKGVVKTTELAAFINVAPASVTEMLKTLQKEGYVNYEKYRGVSLTEKGNEAARSIRRKHHIMERFLTDVLDVDHQQAHDEAHAAEHTISDDTANKICRIIGPKVDCDCTTCSNPCSESDETRIAVSVVDMGHGSKGTISHLSCTDTDVIKRLIAMGFVPGRELEVISKISDKGPRIVKIGDASIALDYDLASAVMIENR